MRGEGERRVRGKEGKEVGGKGGEGSEGKKNMGTTSIHSVPSN